MILLPEERMAVVLGMDVSKGLTRGSTTRRLWPNGIVYYELNATLGITFTDFIFFFHA
jgi:hypothetical protein